jgi:uncharacterized protein YfiM (DUF2279 family)
VRLTAHNNLRGASRATFRRRASVAALAAEAGLRTAPPSGSLWSWAAVPYAASALIRDSETLRRKRNAPTRTFGKR